MRHLRSILYALVLAPAVWILSGVGFTHDLTGRARDSGSVETVTGLLLLLLAGAAYGILLFAPISPAGPVLFGVVYLAVGVWALAGPGSYADLWPSSVAKPGFDLSLPGYGLAVLLAVPLIGTALSARRWDRYEPPQIPLIGTLGRPRGAATVGGAMQTEILTPYAAQEADPTQVIKLPGGATTVLPEMDATQIVDLPAPDATQVVDLPAPDATQIVHLSAPDATQVVGTPADATQVVGSVAPDATQIVESPSPSSEDEPTEVAVVEDETEAVAAVEDDAEPVTVAVVEDETETVAEADDDAEPATVAVVEVTEVVVAEVEAADVPGDDEPKTELVALAEGDKTELVALAEGDKTELVALAEGDKTELVQLEETVVAPEAEDSDATDLVAVEDDATVTVIAEPATDEPAADAEAAVPADDVTEEAAPADDAVTEASAAAPADDVTEAVAAVHADDVAAEDEPTVAAEPAADEAVAEPTVAVTEEAVVEEPVFEAPVVEEPVVAQAESEAEEAAAAEDTAGEEAAAATAADEAASEPATDEEEAVETAADVVAMFEKLNPRRVASDDDQERTQVIRLPATELVTHDLRGRITPVMPPPDDRPTRVINRGALRGSEPGERTQVIRMPQKPEPAKSGPPTVEPAEAEPAKAEPAKTKATDESERTQVIRLGKGTVEPPDERTQVIKLPVPPPARTESRTEEAEEEPEEKTTPKGPSSVMGAERPNFAEDPTTRLMPPKSDEDQDAENGNSRTMTVTNLERPADELADDLTRPLVPGPRSPDSGDS